MAAIKSITAYPMNYKNTRWRTPSLKYLRRRENSEKAVDTSSLKLFRPVKNIIIERQNPKPLQLFLQFDKILNKRNRNSATSTKKKGGLV